MKIIAWNVNGIRSLLETNNLDLLIEHENPDILCMGETKLSCVNNDIVDAQITLKYPQFKFKYWSLCKLKKGYSGTVILCKKKPINVYYGLKHGNKDIDEEGRVIVIQMKSFYLLHVYTPNSGIALNRLKWRTTEWDRAFENYINYLQTNKPIIICGDLNVSYQTIDIANPKSNKKTAGFTDEERESFGKILLNCGLIDTYRYLHPSKIEYSFWSYMKKSREKNIGWRLDYFLVSNILKNKIKESSILTNVLGSDHAPIKFLI